MSSTALLTQQLDNRNRMARTVIPNAEFRARVHRRQHNQLLIKMFTDGHGKLLPGIKWEVTEYFPPDRRDATVVAYYTHLAQAYRNKVARLNRKGDRQ